MPEPKKGTEYTPLLGAIADDFTGATDLASTLVKGGMRTVQIIGVPEAGRAAPACDAIVVSLKSRTAPVRQARQDSVAALRWLEAQHCRQFFFKYCSTFDSTDKGNIGPVADALLAALGARFALVCPAFPTNGRTIYQGHLFVGAALLNESGMENHPLTPMRDANLVRVLSRQTDGAVGLIALPIVARGAAAIEQEIAALKSAGKRYAVIDAVSDRDLLAIGRAASGQALVTGGSGIAIGLPENFRRLGLLREQSTDATSALPVVHGAAAVLAGSCSHATLTQIETSPFPTFRLDPLANDDATTLAGAALAWAATKLGETPIVIAASAEPARVARLQQQLGRERAGALMESVLASIAERLIAQGVRRLVVAGGETAGAIVARLKISELRIGPEIAPGVPWTFAERAEAPLLLALKSGNFGGPDFFHDAFAAVTTATRARQ